MINRVLIIALDTEGGGGTETWLREFLKVMSKNQHITLLTTSIDQTIQNLPIKSLKIFVPRRPMLLRLTCFLIAGSFYQITFPRKKFDVIHVIGAIYSGYADIRTVHFSHLDFSKTNFDKMNFRNSLHKVNRSLYNLFCKLTEIWLYRAAKTGMITTVSEEMVERLETLHQVEIRLVRNGISREAGAANKFIKHKKKEGPWQRGELKLLFVGGDWQRKRLLDALKVLQILISEKLHIELAIAGSGDEHQLQKWCTELGIENQVSYLGFLDKELIPYEAADFLICTSSYEASPLVFLEAALKGTPTVSYKVHGVKKAKQLGFLEEVEDCTPDSMAREILRIVKDKNAYKKMQKSTSAAATTFSWSEASSNWNSIYNCHS